MSILNGILLSGLSYGSVYLFATSCDHINTYWNYYYSLPVWLRPRYKYINPLLILNGIVLWVSGSMFGFVCYKALTMQ